MKPERNWGKLRDWGIFEYLNFGWLPILMTVNVGRKGRMKLGNFSTEKKKVNEKPGRRLN